MDRLTKRVGVGEAVPAQEGDICKPFLKAGLCKTGVMLHLNGKYGWQRHCNDECLIGKLLDRLAAYEDTGLTPEEISALKQFASSDNKTYDSLILENAALRAQLKAMTKERDAAVEDLRRVSDFGVHCSMCKKRVIGRIKKGDCDGRCAMFGGFEWRGITE